MTFVTPHAPIPTSADRQAEKDRILHAWDIPAHLLAADPDPKALICDLLTDELRHIGDETIAELVVVHVWGRAHWDAA